MRDDTASSTLGEAYAAQAISIPLYPSLTDALQDRVVAALASALSE